MRGSVSAIDVRCIQRMGRYTDYCSVSEAELAKQY